MADAEQVYRAHPTSEEVAEALARRLVAAVGSLNEDGSIHLAFVLFLQHDGRLYFETASVTRKARNAARGGWASMLVQGRASTGRNLMVSGEGTARVLDGPEAHDLNHRLRAKYIKPEALDGIDRAWAAWTTSPSRSPHDAGAPGPARSSTTRPARSFQGPTRTPGCPTTSSQAAGGSAGEQTA
jgi:Pyridoxamine 5'-phosphate oxidase